MWEKEKLLVTSNFFFSHSLFYSFGELSTIFIEFDIVVCKPFQFGKILKFVVQGRVNSLPFNKIFDLSKFKGFSGNTLMLDQILRFALYRMENIVEKGENARYQHFLLFPQCFLRLKSSRLGLLKIRIVW